MKKEEMQQPEGQNQASGDLDSEKAGNVSLGKEERGVVASLRRNARNVSL